MTALDDIATPRLSLRLMPIKVLKALARQDQSKAGAGLGIEPDEAMHELAKLAAMRLKQIRADPDYLPWSLRAIIPLGASVLAGYCNFHGSPGAEGLKACGRRAVEIGYTILPAYRREGYGFETVSALSAWARRQGCDALVLSVAPDNIASLRLAAKLGARKVGEQIDEEDGLEYVFSVALR